MDFDANLLAGIQAAGQILVGVYAKVRKFS